MGGRGRGMRGRGEEWEGEERERRRGMIGTGRGGWVLVCKASGSVRGR